MSILNTFKVFKRKRSGKDGEVREHPSVLRQRTSEAKATATRATASTVSYKVRTSATRLGKSVPKENPPLLDWLFCCCCCCCCCCWRWTGWNQRKMQLSGNEVLRGCGLNLGMVWGCFLTSNGSCEVSSGYNKKGWYSTEWSSWNFLRYCRNFSLKSSTLSWICATCEAREMKKLCWDCIMSLSTRWDVSRGRWFEEETYSAMYRGVVERESPETFRCRQWLAYIEACAPQTLQEVSKNKDSGAPSSDDVWGVSIQNILCTAKTHRLSSEILPLRMEF